MENLCAWKLGESNGVNVKEKLRCCLVRCIYANPQSRARIHTYTMASLPLAFYVLSGKMYFVLVCVDSGVPCSGAPYVTKCKIHMFLRSFHEPWTRNMEITARRTHIRELGRCMHSGKCFHICDHNFIHVF